MQQSSIIIYHIVHQLYVFKTEKKILLYSWIVGLCNTQIGGFSPILTKNPHQQIKKKSVTKSADFFWCQAPSADVFWSVVNRLVLVEGGQGAVAQRYNGCHPPPSKKKDKLGEGGIIDCTSEPLYLLCKVCACACYFKFVHRPPPPPPPPKPFFWLSGYGSNLTTVRPVYLRHDRRVNDCNGDR